MNARQDALDSCLSEGTRALISELDRIDKASRRLIQKLGGRRGRRRQAIETPYRREAASSYNRVGHIVGHKRRRDGAVIFRAADGDDHSEEWGGYFAGLGDGDIEQEDSESSDDDDGDDDDRSSDSSEEADESEYKDPLAAEREEAAWSKERGNLRRRKIAYAEFVSELRAEHHRLTRLFYEKKAKQLSSEICHGCESNNVCIYEDHNKCEVKVDVVLVTLQCSTVISVAAFRCKEVACGKIFYPHPSKVGCFPGQPVVGTDLSNPTPHGRYKPVWFDEQVFELFRKIELAHQVG